MPDKRKLTDEERQLFRQAAQGARPIRAQDKVPRVRPQDTARSQRKRQAAIAAQKSVQRAQASHPFSNDFEPALPEGTMKYVAAGANPYLSKQLRRGDFTPELVVDLHGMTQQQAQRDLAAAVSDCLLHHIDCMNVIHGVGTGVLRKRVPAWLMQHPDVLAFHQAPLEWGGQGALLVLLRRAS